MIVKNELAVCAALLLFQTASGVVLSTYHIDGRVKIKKPLLFALRPSVVYLINFEDIIYMTKDHSYDLSTVTMACKTVEAVDWSAVSFFPAAGDDFPASSYSGQSLFFLLLKTFVTKFMGRSYGQPSPLPLLFLCVMHLHLGSQLERKLLLFSASVILPASESVSCQGFRVFHQVRQPPSFGFSADSRPSTFFHCDFPSRFLVHLSPVFSPTTPSVTVTATEPLPTVTVTVLSISASAPLALVLSSHPLVFSIIISPYVFVTTPVSVVSPFSVRLLCTSVIFPPRLSPTTVDSLSAQPSTATESATSKASPRDPIITLLCERPAHRDEKCAELDNDFFASEDCVLEAKPCLEKSTFSKANLHSQNSSLQVDLVAARANFTAS